jgi:hypothetical protein
MGDTMQQTKRLSLFPVVPATVLLLTVFLVASPQSGAAAASAATNLYSAVIEPLRPEECGRCHTAHYTWLQENGGKHQAVACRDCHVVIHAYNPLRDNYAAIMPQCSSCHAAPHSGAEAVQRCLACHANPHQPLASIPAPAALEDRCRFCHSEVAANLQAEVSMHTELECSACHAEVHGRIPQCDECHENHSPLLPLATPDCLACHPVHTPLAISYPVTQKREACAGCHAEAYSLLQQGQSKHSLLTCARCHARHGQVPVCQDCHGTPHGRELHQKYTACGTCHNIAHAIQK